MDETIVFRSLSAEDIHSIVDLMLNSVRKQVRQQGMELEVSNGVLTKLGNDGFDPQYGARPLRRAVQRLIEDPLSEEVLLGRFGAGDTIRAEIDGEGENVVIIFRKVENPNADPEDTEALAAGRSYPELPPPPVE